MLESLLTKHGLVRRELLELILKTNDDTFIKKLDFIQKATSKIKEIDRFISGLILLNKNSYFGTYSLGYNKELLCAILERDENKFLRIFSNPISSDMFNNHNLSKENLDEIKYYYSLEKMTYFYLYQKKFYDCFYTMNLDRIQSLKKEIYEMKEKNTEIKYFSNKNTISIRKGKETETLDIIEVIFKIFQDVKINDKLDNFIKSNYTTEYYFIKSYLENFNN
jgi:hypothetical protein